MGVGDGVPELGALGRFQSCGGGYFTVEALTELIGQIFVEIGVEGHLLALLAEDIASEEDVQRVIDAAAEVLDALPVVLLLLSLLLVSNLGHEGVLILGVFITTIWSAIACVVQGSLEEGQLLGFTVSDEVRYLLVGGLALLEEHLEDLLRDSTEAAVCVEHILSCIIFVLTVRVVIHIIIAFVSEGLGKGSLFEDATGRSTHGLPDKRTDSWLPLLCTLRAIIDAQGMVIHVEGEGVL